MEAASKAEIYRFSVKKISGEETPLGTYRGKALLIVNTASKCGFTPQYAGLQELYLKYRDRGFEVLAFPSNDFGRQEPGTHEEIREFCDLRFKITFPLFEKIRVKGDKAHPLYHYLTEQSPFKGGIKWNFNKFLVSPEGEIAARFGSMTAPTDGKLVEKLEGLLPS